MIQEFPAIQKSLAALVDGQAPKGAGLSVMTLPSVSFDFTTAAVVSLVMVLLGLAAGLLLMLRIANRQARREGD